MSISPLSTPVASAGSSAPEAGSALTEGLEAGGRGGALDLGGREVRGGSELPRANARRAAVLGGGGNDEPAVGGAVGAAGGGGTLEVETRGTIGGSMPESAEGSVVGMPTRVGCRRLRGRRGVFFGPVAIASS